MNLEDSSSTRAIYLTVDKYATSRLDRWLADALVDFSRSRIQKLIADRCVSVNGACCTHKNALVQPGDRITVVLPEPEPLALVPEAIPLDILYEDDQVLIVNKPAGLVVHPAPGNWSGTLVNAVLAHCGDQLMGIGGVERPGIVHRLDKNTTGAIAVAKTELAHQHLQAQLKDKSARREYLGVVYGVPKAADGRIEAPLGRHPVDRKKQAVVPQSKGGRVAVTHWQIEERLGNFTLMRFRLETGRTHQIRVHCATMGHPIVGDMTYAAGRSVGVNLPGQALHAERLSLKHPVSAETITAIAPLPKHFVTLVHILRKRSGQTVPKWLSLAILASIAIDGVTRPWLQIFLS